jgi:transcriptional regulator with XRE-family HTH domain
MVATEQSDNLGRSLGAHVRELRRERGMTLKALGRAAGLSHPFLSQLERGLARPSMASLERIARALDVDLAVLWAPPAGTGARVVRGDAGHVDSHPDEGAPGALRTLAPGDPLLVREWTGGTRRWVGPPWTGVGRTMVYVMHGAVEVEVNGSRHELAAGDAVYFDGRTPHRLRRTGGPATRALYVSARA